MENIQFFKEVLKGLGIAPTDNNVGFLNTWAKYEGGKAKNNPLNTTFKFSDPNKYTLFNTAKVKNYVDAKTGIDATVRTLKLSYYKNIVNALRSNKPTAEIYYLPNVSKELKTWGTHNFALKFADQKPKKEKGINPTFITVIICVGVLAFLFLLQQDTNIL